MDFMLLAQRGWTMDEGAGTLSFVDGEKNSTGVVDIPSDDVRPCSVSSSCSDSCSTCYYFVPILYHVLPRIVPLSCVSVAYHLSACIGSLTLDWVVVV